MRTYQYAVRTAEGIQVSGTILAEDENEAAVKLREKYEMIVSIRERKGVFSYTGRLSPGRGRARLRSFVDMCGGLEALLGTGVALPEAMRLLSDEISDRSLRRILVLSQNELAEGKGVTEALKESAGDRFPAMFYEILSKGEEKEDIKGAFGECARFFERQERLEEKRRTAYFYPVFVLIAAVAFFVILMLTVVPAFLSIYGDLGKAVPPLLLMLKGISGGIRRALPILLLIAALIAVCFIVMHNTAKGGLLLSKLRLLLPWTGKAERLHAAGILADALSLLFRNGKSLTEATGLSAELMTNRRAEEGLLEIRERQDEGTEFLSSFEEADFLPESFLDIIGKIDEEDRENTEKSLFSAAGYYDTELMRQTKKQISVFSVLLIVLIAFVACFTVITVFLSMFGMYRAVL